MPLGNNQGRCYLPEERARLLRAGGAVVGEGPGARVCGPGGTFSSVSRSLGDAAWKKPGPGFPVVLSCIPEIQCTKLSWADKHLFVLLGTRPVAEAMPSQELVDIAMGFPKQPRASCGEIATKALEKQVAAAQSQCTAVEIWLLPGGPAAGAEDDAGGASGSGAGGTEAPRKKQKVGPGVAQKSEQMSSARLRHILLRLGDTSKPTKPGEKAVRSRVEVEALLRRLMRELREELEELRRKPNQPKKPEELALKSEKFAKLCKEHSECPSAQKGGAMCGDIGWMSPEAQRKLGDSFREGVRVLRPGDLSDIVQSVDGLHLVQRIA